MPQPTDKTIHIRRPDVGFSLEHASATAQNDGSAIRSFTTTAVRYGPLEPGTWEVTFCNETNPGLNGIPPVVFKIGDATVTAVSNVDHIFDLRGWSTVSSAGTSISFGGGGGTFVIEDVENNYISMVGYVGLAAGAILASLQKLG